MRAVVFELSGKPRSKLKYRWWAVELVAEDERLIDVVSVHLFKREAEHAASEANKFLGKNGVLH